MIYNNITYYPISTISSLKRNQLVSKIRRTIKDQRKFTRINIYSTFEKNRNGRAHKNSIQIEQKLFREKRR